MKTIYAINVRSTGCNGGIINSIDSAYTNEMVALDICNAMNKKHQDDLNFIAYVTGPILLYEEEP